MFDAQFDEIIRKSTELLSGKERVLREDAASRVGLTPIGSDSKFAIMIGIDERVPDVVFKICTNEDAFVDYANLCFNDMLKGPHFLKVFARVPIGADHTLFVIERLDRELADLEGDEWFEFEKTNSRFLTKIFAACYDYDDLSTMEPMIAWESGNTLLNAQSHLRCLAIDISRTQNRDLGCDMHRKNIMLRKDGTPVILDPWYDVKAAEQATDSTLT